MSSSKKLRLDPETHPQGLQSPRNQPGANFRGESRGGTFPDASLYSGYPRGNTSFGRNSNSGPFRTKYSRPGDIHSGSSNSFSRFSPYYFGKERRTSLNVPIIRARRDESDLEGLRPSSRMSLDSSIGKDSSTCSATSSTAQKIIETLQNLSTPVLNAGKIRIDQDIKAVQPNSFMTGSSFSRTSPGAAANRSIGPPKMCSSLLLSSPSSANQINPILNTTDPRRLFCIPKMIDAATNTEKHIEISSPTGVYGTNKFGNEMKSSAPIGKTMPAAIKPASSLPTSKDDNNSDDEFHECSSEFVFSSAWSPEVFDRYFENGKEDKSNQIKSSASVSSQQQPLLNGFKDSSSSLPFSKPITTSSSALSTITSDKPSTSTSSKPPPSGLSSTFTGFQSSGTGSFGFGTPPLKESFPQSRKSDAEISEGKPSDQFQSTLSSGTLTKSPVTTLKASSDSSSATVSSSFKFGSSASSGIATTTTEKSEPTKTTFSFGNVTSKSNDSTTTSSFDKVDARKENSISLPSMKPLTEVKSPAAPSPLKVKSPGTKWRCPACMIENELNCQACVCCSEKNPNATAAVAKPVSKKWRCPTCMIENDLEAPACVCCSEKNPNAVVKKWRCTTCMIENEPTVQACVCCSEKNPNAKVEQKEDPAQSGGQQPQASAFKFGISSSVSGSLSTSNAFSFGQPPSSKSPEASSFKFGAPTTSVSTASLASSTISQPVATNTSFKFGVSSSTSSTPLTQPPSFGFTSPASTVSQPALSTNTATTTTTNSFGEAKPALEITSPIATPTTTVFGSGSFQSSNNNSFSFAGSSAAAGDAAKPASTFGYATPSTTTSDIPKPASTSTFGFPTPSGTASDTPKPSSAFGFAGSSATASDTQKPFNFGTPTNTKPAFNTFSFGGSQPNSGSTTAPSPMSATSASTPTSSFGSNSGGFSFGSASQPASNVFGSTPTPSGPTNQPSSGFQFGGAAPLNPLSPSPAPTPGPNSFSLTPNLNFGTVPGISIPFGNPTQPTPTAGSQPPPALFQFSAAPVNESSPGGRQIKKAVRRFKK